MEGKSSLHSISCSLLCSAQWQRVHLVNHLTNRLLRSDNNFHCWSFTRLLSGNVQLWERVRARDMNVQLNYRIREKQQTQKLNENCLLNRQFSACESFEGVAISLQNPQHKRKGTWKTKLIHQISCNRCGDDVRISSKKFHFLSHRSMKAKLENFPDSSYLAPNNRCRA